MESFKDSMPGFLLHSARGEEQVLHMVKARKASDKYILYILESASGQVIKEVIYGKIILKILEP